MNTAPSPAEEFDSLLAALVDGQLSPQQFSLLQRQLAEDPAAEAYYRRYMRLCAFLEFERASAQSEEGPAAATGEAEDDGAKQHGTIAQPLPIVLQTLPSLQPSTAESFSDTSPVFIATWHGTTGYLSSGWPVAYLAATVIFGMGLLIGSLVHVSQPVEVAHQLAPLPSRLSPLPSIVGRITGMVDCRWDEGSGFRVQGPEISKSPNLQNSKSLVSLSDRFALASGLVEITYNSGAKVILQGPVTYEVESKDGGYLSVGKLTAKMGKRSEPANQKSEIKNQRCFAVRTPTATVTDLGTEFGVEVDKQGNTISHVFRGVVKVQAAAISGRSESAAQILRENESVQVDGGQGCGRIVTVSAAKLASFTREIPKRSMKTLDLVDVLAGGDGYSSRRNRWIDPTTGRVSDVPPVEPSDPRKRPVDDGTYHRVKAIPFVDGVFVPASRRGPVQVDSAGHTFDDFGSSDSRVYRYLWAGGAPRPAWASNVRTKLGEIDYASSGHGLLYLHANKGITFDLEAIRRANPGGKLLRFRATAGNTENASEKGQPVYADFCVLVDGDVRFRRRQINYYNGVFPVAVPLSNNDRFLTLASADGGNGIAVDWILFGDPRLEIESAKPISVPDAGGP